jgi:hypothetical protein
MSSLRACRSVAMQGEDGMIHVDLKIPDSVNDLDDVELEEGEEQSSQNGASGVALHMQQATAMDNRIHVLHVTYHRCDVAFSK